MSYRKFKRPMMPLPELALPLFAKLPRPLMACWNCCQPEAWFVVLLVPLDRAIPLSVLWGLLLLAGLSFFIARAQAIAPWKVIGEHLVIALCVVALTHAVGDWVASYVADGGP